MSLRCTILGHKPKLLSKFSADMSDTFITLLSPADNEGKQYPVGVVNICDRCGLLYWTDIGDTNARQL